VDGFKDDEDVNRNEDGETNVNGLCFKTVFDVNVQSNTASSSGSRGVGHHHGANEQQQSKRNLPSTVGKEMGIHREASEMWGDECTL
jgi:hypothetical protein